jgi:hypothetical protein
LEQWGASQPYRGLIIGHLYAIALEIGAFKEDDIIILQRTSQLKLARYLHPILAGD